MCCFDLYVDMTHVTSVFLSPSHSVCIHANLPAYNMTAQQAEFLLNGSYAEVGELRVWRTHLKFDGTPSSVFQQLPSIKVRVFIVALMPSDQRGLFTF